MDEAKNYRNDGDSVFRLFYDTVKGGDFRAREANAYRLAQVSVNIIDQCVAQGVPFARDYGGLLEPSSFGGVQVERTFYAGGQRGEQWLLGAYQALEQQIAAGTVTMHTRSEMLDLVVIDGKARGIVTRDLRTGAIHSHVGAVVVLGTGGYSNVFYLSTNAKASTCTAIWRAHRRGALFGNPCFTQIHPTCIPQAGEYQSKLTLMSESLRNDGRIWVPKQKGDTRKPTDIPESERDYYLERRYPSFGSLVPRDVTSRAATEVCDEGRDVGPGGERIYSQCWSASTRRGRHGLGRGNGGGTGDSFQREVGRLMWDNCGMDRSDDTLRRALAKIPELRDEFRKNVRVLGAEEELNQSLEKAGRVADFLELAELMCTDALHRTESCGGHFRIESETSEGEAKRDDDNFCYVAAWEYTGRGQAPALHKEPLTFEHVHLSQRSYK